MSRHQSRSSNAALIPYDTPANQQSTISHPRHHHQHHQSVDPFQSLMMQSFEDPLGPSLFGHSSLMPQQPSNLFDMMNRQHQQLTQSAFGHFGMSAGRPFDSMMDMATMMSPTGFDQGSGCYSSQVMMMSSSVGPDGRQHVEKYAKSSTGNPQHRIRETKEAYTNSAAGVDKLAWERQLENRGRRVVKERNRDTGEVVSNDEIAGMARDEECEHFNTDWNRLAQQHLPLRARINPSLMSDFGMPFNQLPNGQTSQQPRQIQAAEVTEQEEPPHSQRRSHRATRQPRRQA